MKIEEKMNKTVELAQQALVEGELPIAAIIYLDEQIISSAYTSEKLHKRFMVHAELKALLDADCKLYSIEERKRMQLFTTLEPCMMCLGAAMTFFVGEIYYALEAPMDGAVHFAKKFWSNDCSEIPSYTLPRIIGGIQKTEVKGLFREYALRNPESPMYFFALSLAGMQSEV